METHSNNSFAYLSNCGTAKAIISLSYKLFQVPNDTEQFCRKRGICHELWVWLCFSNGFGCWWANTLSAYSWRREKSNIDLCAFSSSIILICREASYYMFLKNLGPLFLFMRHWMVHWPSQLIWRMTNRKHKCSSMLKGVDIRKKFTSFWGQYVCTQNLYLQVQS